MLNPTVGGKKLREMYEVTNIGRNPLDGISLIQVNDPCG
jgi:hypothetical protein